MTKFSDLKLDPKVLAAIVDAGYETPTPIQAGAIPLALEGRDVLGIAQTGTGKTASFTLPMITLLGRGRARARMPRSLVLCPTRELAAQVAENFDIYAKNTKLTKALLIGGVSFTEQDKLIDRGVDVLIATPGRLLDHFERGKLLLTGVQIMVVDEADRMLDMGFIPDIERIFQLTPFTRQTLFFSATMAPEIERITDTFLHSPERIEVARQATTSETITQRLVEITPTRKDQSAKQKRELMRALIVAEGEELKNAIIFCNRKTEVDIVAKSLRAHGFDAAPIHGDLDQSQRTRTLDDFRDGKLRFLVASDVAARGLDIPAVSHVFNFDLPSHAEDYVHRIGRTGRAGRKGTAISIGVPADEKYLTAIEALVKQSLPRGEVPEGFSLSEAARGAPRKYDDKPRGAGRGRNERDRRGRRSEDHAPKADAAPAPAAVAEGTARDHRNERDTRRERHAEDRREDRRDDRRREDRSHRHHGSPVIGMGDHLPEFMTRSFRPSIIEPETASDTPEPAAAPAREEKPEPKPRKSRSRSRKTREDAAPVTEPAPEVVAETAAPVAEAAAPVAEAPVSEAPAEALTEATEAPAEDAAPAKPARKSARSSKKAAEKKPAAKKPASRKKKSDAEATASAEPVAEPTEAAEEPAEKPKRKRAPRKKKADEPAATAEGVATAAESAE